MKKKILPAFLSFFLIISAFNASSQGGPFPLNTTVNGNVTSTTPDTWDITTTSDGLLQLTLTAVSPADFNITLYDNDGVTVIAGPLESVNNATVTLNADGLAPGTYHVKITPFGSAFGAYTLTNAFFTPDLTNDAEPNGTAATALTLPLNASATGHVGYYYNHLRDTADWYKVTTNADGLLQVSLTSARGSVSSNNALDVNVFLYDNDGTTQLGSVEVFNGNGPATDVIKTDGLAPGTYYIKVQPFSTDQFADYTLSNTLITTGIGNDVEPNGTAITALTLPLNASATGHVGYYYNHQRDTADWYKVTTNADGLLQVSLTSARGSASSNNALDVNVWLYDNDGTTQLGSVEVFNGNGPAANVINADGLAPGTYYIKVQPFATNQFANYTLSNTLITPGVANDAEPNGTAITALTLPLNASATGHVGYYYNHLRDTADWYKVTTNADGLLQISLTSARGSASSNNALDVNVWLYDNDGTTLLGSVEVYNGNGPATNVINADGLAPGTYYIKVQPFATDQFADYTLSNTLTVPAIAGDPEPNGTSATAVALPLATKLTGHVGYYYNNRRDTADWYKVTTTSDGLLRVYLTTARGSVSSTNTLDVNVWLYDNDGSTLLGSVEVFNGNGPATNKITADGLAPGTYYIKVQPFSTDGFADYTIYDSLFVPTLANDAEPNGTKETAVTLPANSSLTGHVGYYYNKQRDTTDWYKITTTATGQLQIGLTTARGSVYSINPLDVNVWLYAIDGITQLGAKEVFNGNGPATNSITIDGLAPGTYYVKVRAFSTDGFANYTITNGQVTSNVAVTVTSLPAGLTVLVDGVTYTSPQTFQWIPASSHTIATASPQSLVTGSGTQYVWSNWSDGLAISHSVTGPASITTYTANFSPQYLLTTLVNPGGAGTILPATGFYDPGNIMVSASAGTGSVFSGFSGSLSGTTNPQTLNLSSPASVTANFQSQLQASAVATNPLCSGGNGSVKLTVAGGTQPYSFVWNNGAITQNLSSVPPGNYSVMVKDASGMTVQANAVVGQAPVFSLPSITGVFTVCAGQSTTLKETSTGGIWSSDNLNVASVDQSGVVSGKTSGKANITYSATNSNGCSAKTSAAVSVNAAPVVGSISGSTMITKGSTVIFTDPSKGGTWSSSNNFVATITSAGIVKGIAAGNAIISYKISNISGCSAIATKTITVYSILSASASAGRINCFGGITTLRVNAIGGSVTYQFSLNGGKFQTGNAFTVPAGVYVVVVKDNMAGQVTLNAIVIGQPSPLALSLTKETNATGRLSNGSFTVKASGGTPSYRYSIDGGLHYQSSATFNNLSTGTYLVSVQDANGCSLTNAVRVVIARGGSKNVDADVTYEGQADNAELVPADSTIDAQLMPNPSVSDFTLQVKSNTRQTIEIVVMDMLGHAVYHTTGEATNTYRFGGMFKNGMYIVEIIHKNGIKVMKAIKQ